MVGRVLSLLSLPAILGLLANGQHSQQWTERRNLGFEGPVRSVLTTVTKPNPDPRPQTGRQLIVSTNPDWVAFDIQGRRVEFGSAINRDRVEAISKCRFEVDGTEVCADSSGRTQESRNQEITLPDGSREKTYSVGSKVVSRDVTLFDEKDHPIASRSYDGNGRLRSKSSILPNGDDEWKIYDDNGHVASDVQTRVSDDQRRFDRWSYDPEGHLVWHLALNADGEVLSQWYEVGYRPKVSSSDSLAVYQPGLMVSYKFDEQGSGRIEKFVKHTSGERYLEPDSEEHFNFDGVLDEKAEIKYARDARGNWTFRSVFVWDPSSNRMIEIERDTRTIQYY